MLQVINSGEYVEAVINVTVSVVDINHQPMVLGDSKLYQIIYGNVLYYPVMYILPLGTLALLNVRLISSLNAIKRRTSVPSATRSLTLNFDVQGPNRRRRRRKDDNITVCVVVIVCVFIICQTPALFNQIFWALFELAERDCGRFHFYYTKFSDLLVVVNSSCNFVVYCLFGKTFRRTFLSTVCCCCSCCGDLGDTASAQQQYQQQEGVSEVRSRLGTATTAKLATIRVGAVSEVNRSPQLLSCNHSRF